MDNQLEHSLLHLIIHSPSSIYKIVKSLRSTHLHAKNIDENTDDVENGVASRCIFVK